MENDKINTKGVVKNYPGSTLKIIAIVTMFIDHLGAGILERYLGCMESSGGDFRGALGNSKFLLKMIDEIFRCVGRLGFPIFIFLLIEGFKHTRSVPKYARNLLIFALISEFPFDSAFNSDYAFEFSYQNVYFTLFFGLLVVWGISIIRKKDLSKLPIVPIRILGTIVASLGVYILIADSILMFPVSLLNLNTSSIIFLGFIWGIIFVIDIVLNVIITKKFTENSNMIFISATIITIGMIAATLIRCDYGAYGVLAILMMYLASENWEKAYLFTVLTLSIHSPVEIIALGGLPIVQKYNGERGLKLKYIFYIFYPAHLLLIAVLEHCVGIF